MSNIEVKISEIPHGHGLSFKKGIADAILENREHENSCHETHLPSYQRGYEVGKKMVSQIASHVKA